MLYVLSSIHQSFNKQWGYVQITDTNLYPLPISFTKFYTGVASPDIQNGSAIGVNCSNMSNVTLYATQESYKRYIVIGL